MPLSNALSVTDGVELQPVAVDGESVSNSRIVVLSRLTGVTIPLEDRFEWGDAAGELACAETPWWPVDPSCPLRYPPKNLATSQ